MGRASVGKIIDAGRGNTPMKLLFLCSQNKRRSLTAEKLFAGYIIFCMKKKHLRRIKAKYSEVLAGKEVVCLNIEDEYEYMDEELCAMLESSVDEYLDRYMDW